MSNLCVKRPFRLLIDSTEPNEPEIYFPSARKQVKKALTIEVYDSFAEKTSNPHVRSYNMPQNTPFSINKPYSVQTPRNSSKRSTTSSPRFPSEFMFPPNSESSRNTTASQTEQYDDYYLEGNYYNVTMQKCNRRTMEDRAVLEPELCVGDKFFGIYDGHSSSYVSDYLEQNFHKKISSHPRFSEEPKVAFKEAFQQADKEILQKLETSNLQGGSTALCALIRDKKLYVANAGDSKAAVIKSNQIHVITREHRASNEEEKLRVENLGGVIIVHKSRSLVQGSLAVTRSLGDRKYKKFVSCEPDVHEYDISAEDQMVVMASDGFWDLMSNDEVMEIVNDKSNNDGLSKRLVDAAMKKRSYGLDNISLIVIDLPKLYNKY